MNLGSELIGSNDDSLIETLLFFLTILLFDESF